MRMLPSIHAIVVINFNTELVINFNTELVSKYNR